VNWHVFVDESRRGSLYLLAAALARSTELGPTRSLMRGLRVPGERRLHFKSERDTIKKDIAGALVSGQVRTRVYCGRGEPGAARQRLLEALVADLMALDVRRMVFDSRGPDRDQADRRIVHSALTCTGVDLDLVTYEHLRSHEEPALWVPDAVAWCYGAGGEWRRRVEPVVEKAVDVGKVARRRR
jgi:hypothetical protein